MTVGRVIPAVNSGNYPLTEKVLDKQKIILCKNCKHWRRCECGSYGSCEERDGFYDADWFCGDAEQKDGDPNG